MKKSVISLVLMGCFLLLSNLIFAQNSPPPVGDNSTIANQGDPGTAYNSVSNP